MGFQVEQRNRSRKQERKIAALKPLDNKSPTAEGFRNLDGKCVAVQIPQNAELDVFGTGWACRRGFRNLDGKCVVVQIPENATTGCLWNRMGLQTGISESRRQVCCGSNSPVARIWTRSEADGLVDGHFRKCRRQLCCGSNSSKCRTGCTRKWMGL